VVTWIVLVFSILMALFTTFLLAFHCRLINRNLTTNEFLKNRTSDRHCMLREASWCARFGRTMSCRRRPGSYISNDLIRISLLIESILLESDSLQMSIGGTPMRAGEQSLLQYDPAMLGRK